VLLWPTELLWFGVAGGVLEMVVVVFWAGPWPIVLLWFGATGDVSEMIGVVFWADVWTVGVPPCWEDTIVGTGIVGMLTRIAGLVLTVDLSRPLPPLLKNC